MKEIFTTGTSVSKLTPASDLDLIVILDKNSEGIKSVFTTIGNHFSDVFFFDVDFLNQLSKKREVLGNTFDGMFVAWLSTSEIAYDTEHLLRNLKEKIAASHFTQKVSDVEKTDVWVKTNYNFIANSRYYNAGDKLYRRALELRLLYSVSELITAYFSFRGMPWRGEKAAVRYFEEHDKKFLETFRKYSASGSLEKKMKYYRALFAKVFFGTYRRWEKGFIVPISNVGNRFDPGLRRFWSELIGGA